MKDLYRRLNLSDDASDAQIRTAIASAEPALRDAAELILLDPRRRGVYDRNRRLLLAIGELRAHLGLNFTRFWARGDFKDFWKELAPMPPPRAARRVDPMMIAQAIVAVGRHGKRRATEPLAWLWAIIAALAAFLIIVAWRHWM